jgi:hypothetical protein
LWAAAFVAVIGQAPPAGKEKAEGMAEVIGHEESNQTVPHQEGETREAKSATFGALFQINQGFNDVLQGLDKLKAAGLIEAELFDEERIDEHREQVQELQAIVNHSFLPPLVSIEQRDAFRFGKQRMDREKKRRKEDRRTGLKTAHQRTPERRKA